MASADDTDLPVTPAGPPALADPREPMPPGAQADAAAPGDAILPPDREGETTQQWILRFLEANEHLAKPSPPPPPQPPEPRSIHLMSPQEMHEALPPHLRAQRPDGSYIAMRLIARMNTDLVELTQGKRAATYPEVDEYLGHALIAEGVAPQGFTAEEATRWWRTGGYRALAASPKGQPSLDGPELRAASVPSPEDGAMTNDSAPMEVPEGDSEGSERGAVSPGVSTAGISQSPAQSSTMSTGRPTTFEDVLRGVDAWSPRGAAPDKAPVEHRPRPEQAKNQPPKPARPPSAKVAPATAPGISGTRMWPVAGNGAYAIGNSREKGPNHKFYSDGNYDPKGTGLRGKSHFGLDEKSKLGAPVYAAASGTLYMIGTQTITRKDKKKRPVLDKHNRPIRVPAGYGNFIAILHPDGYVTIYGHLPPPSKYMRSLKPGDPIAIGTQIATVGNTGNAGAKGDHLHFEVRVSNGTRTMGYASSGGNHTVDPRLWMKGALPNVPIIPSNVDPLAHPKPRILAARKR